MALFRVLCCCTRVLSIIPPIHPATRVWREVVAVPAPAELPIKNTIRPADQNELVAAVNAACAEQTPLYPIGGGTSLDYGLPAKREGSGLSLAGLDRVVDFPARDMTITVEAGVRMATLAKTLAAERQQLPIDVPRE